MLIHLKRFNKGESSRVYGKITSADDRFTSNSSAYSFDLNGLAVFTVPNSLQLTKLDAIAAFGKWFTGGHIETGGDDSVTHVPLGKKLMIIAERGIKSRNLEKLLQSSQAVLNFLTKGPQSPSIREKVRFYFTTPSSLMIQPALCAHTVITMSTGASLVAGFEAKSCKDDKAVASVQLLFLWVTKRSDTSGHSIATLCKCVEFSPSARRKPEY